MLVKCLFISDTLKYTLSGTARDKAKDEAEFDNAIYLRSAGVGGMSGSLTL